jgi:hypothetical protein
MNEELQRQILDSIAESGKAEVEEIKINTNLSDILNLSSGAARIQKTVERKAKLILSQPHTLCGLSNLLIRCCLCHKVISYPCWYYSIKYAVNHFHYFICFDSNDTSKPTISCYKRSI